MGANLSCEVAVLDAVRHRDARRVREVLRKGNISPSRISRLLTSAELENLPRGLPGIPPPPNLPIGSSLLHEAAESHAPTLKVLLDYEPPLHKRDVQGLTPLGRAIRAKNLETIKLLCNAGARPLEKHAILPEGSTLPKDLNDSRSHIRYMAAIGNVDILSILINTAGTGEFEADGARAIHEAIATGNVKCVKLLLEKDLEGVQNDIPEGMTEEEWNMMWSKGRSKRSLQLFTIRQAVEESADNDEEENDDEDNEQDTEDQSESGDDDDDTDDDDDNEANSEERPGNDQPTTIATQLDELVSVLRQALATVHTPVAKGFRGLSLLHYACTKSQPKVLEYLLSTKEFGIAIDDPNESCKSPIFLAVRSQSRECFDVLVSAGADVLASDMENWTLLHEAVKVGDSGDYFIRQLIDVHKLDVNAIDDDGWTPLHVAARFSSTNAVDILVERGAKVDAMTDEKETPLLFAASHEKSAAVLLKLLGYGADLTVYENTPLSPIRLIISRHDDVQLGYLLDHIANLDVEKQRIALSTNISNETDDPLLHYVCRQSEPRVVAQLAALVQNINATNTEGATALHVATFRGKSSIVDALINRGADPDIHRPDGTTAMHVACDRGHVATVRSLLKGGANPDLAVTGSTNRYYGFTPLMFASRQGSRGAIKHLLEAGANINATKDDGFTALHLATLNRHVKICRMLMASGASSSMLNSQGLSALHIAVRNQSVQLVTELLIGGADPNVPSSRSLVPLHLAIAQADTQIVWILIRAQADVNFPTGRYETPVHIAANGERTQTCLQLLLANGGRHDVRDVDGDTPLHVACIPGRSPQVRMLLHRGANPSATNNSGATPLHYTALHGNDTIAKLLVKFGADIDIKDHRGETAYALASRRDNGKDLMLLIYRVKNLSLDDIAPRSQYKTDPSASAGDPPMCVICQHRFVENEAIRTLHCGHRYHDECIESWLGGDSLSRHSSCPLCQANVLPPDHPSITS